MTKIDIFESAKEKTVPEWAKFSEAGDSVQGTYVGKIIGQVDGYGNEQIIYQLLQEDGKIINVGFGLNKKVLHQDMQPVTFGQIVGFRYKGKLLVKDKFGKPVEVKDFSLHQDPKIVNEVWLKENKDNMPEVVVAEKKEGIVVPGPNPEGSLGAGLKPQVEDVPFSSKDSLTNADKLAVIEKLAKEKLGATDSASVKALVMEKVGVAFIPIQYDKIVESLTKL